MPAHQDRAEPGSLSRRGDLEIQFGHAHRRRMLAPVSAQSHMASASGAPISAACTAIPQLPLSRRLRSRGRGKAHGRGASQRGGWRALSSISQDRGVRLRRRPAEDRPVSTRNRASACAPSSGETTAFAHANEISARGDPPRRRDDGADRPRRQQGKASPPRRATTAISIPLPIRSTWFPLPTR